MVNSRDSYVHWKEGVAVDSQEVLVLGLLESEIFKGDIRPNLCVCLCVCVFVCLSVCPLFNPGKNKKERKKNEKTF